FPKEEDIRKQWLAFCGINEHVLNTVTKLCANHFREEDMIKKVKRSYIKPNTVPSIYRKKTKRSLQFDSFNNKIYSKKKKEYIATDGVNVDCNILIKAQRAIKIARDTIARQRRKIKTLQQCRNRLVTRITTLKSLVKHLEQKNLLTELAAEHLKIEIPDIMNEILKWKKGSKKKYEELRSFALTLNFYSSKAYNYVRKKFRNLLPESSTIRKWYSVLNGRPGFTNEVLHTLKCKVRKMEDPIFCNLVIDEIGIREQIEYDGNRYYGYVDLGVNSNTTNVDNPLPARNALVFMLVALNNHWKVPLGYFLINSLDGKERASLLEKSLELIHEAGVILHSLTFDGNRVNITMCTNLGANFHVGETFKPYILNPITKEKIFCFLDPCHAIKLVRNTLGDKLILRYNEKQIYWANIVSLQNLQETEGLKAATELTKKHIMYKNNKMNVKLAAQTLSESVSTALKFVNQLYPKQFNLPEETALFCLMFNDAFDLLNVRTKFNKKKCKMALTNDNFNELKSYAVNIIEYIKQLFTEVDDVYLSADAFDRDYLSRLCQLSPYIDEVVKYISGFVVRKLLKNICHVCATFITANSTNSILINLKNRGNLVFPSQDVIKITQFCEKVIRANYNIVRTRNNIKAILTIQIYQEICDSVFNDSKITEHIMQQDLFDNHKSELIKSIIEIYLNLRLFHEAKCTTNVGRKEYVRHKYKKLIHFKHQ
ncbi:THAP domain-containing protein 9, partial [Trachymyrmex cornetzi]